MPGAAGAAGALGVPLLTVRPAAATPEKMQAAIKAVVGEAPVKKGRVTLDIPPLVENGNTVAMTVTVESPMTPADHVKVVHVFNEKNPQPNVIDAHFGPRAGARRVLLAHPPRRHPDPRRHRRDERRLVLVRPGRRHRHARRLPGVQLMARTLINVPAKAKRGQVIEIKTLISHVMETGYRRNEVGAVVPRDIINAFVCTYNGEEVFRAGLYPAIAANPFFSFFVTASESGKFEFKWTDDEGNVETASAEITVE